MVQKVLITGITGMVGSHLADYLLDNYSDVEIYGLVRQRSPLDNIKHILGLIHLVPGDLTDLTSMWRVMQRDYDKVIHCAAMSFVPFSFFAPRLTLETNIIGTLNLLDAIFAARQNPRILVVSSSEVYGQVDESLIPINESCPLTPVSPYAVSKVGEDLLAQQYHLSYKLDIVRTRGFSHTGPRRGKGFSASAFAQQIALIEAGKQSNPILVGNLDSVRTWADVRDIVRAYWLALDFCEPGVYNVGGNRTETVGKVLEMLESMSKVPVKHVIDRSLIRPSDVTLQIPDTTKFREATGWKSEILLEDTLADLLDYWRGKVGTV